MSNQQLESKLSFIPYTVFTTEDTEGTEVNLVHAGTEMN